MLDPHEAYEQGYIQGKRRMARDLLNLAFRELDCHEEAFGDDVTAIKLEIARLKSHEEDTRAALRQLSCDLDCNDWPDHLHLADVVEKYIGRSIPDDEEPDDEEETP